MNLKCKLGVEMVSTIQRIRHYSSQYLIWVMFIVSPFFCLLVSLRNLSEKYSKHIITAFCGFYGYTFVTQRNTMDSYRHRADFVDWSRRTNLTFNQFVDFLYGENFSSADVLMPFLKFSLSRFTNNPDILYLVLGLLFGYFFSRNLVLVHSFAKGNKLGTGFFILLSFAYLIAPWEINSFRFWIAAHIFFMGIFPFLVWKDRRKLWLLLITPFIHFSFIYALVVFLIYLLMGNRVKFYFTVFICSLFISNINTEQLNKALPKTNIDVLENRKSTYIREMDESKIEAKSRLNWYVTGRQIPFRLLSIIVVILYFFRERERLKQQEYYSLFCFSLLFLGLNLIFLSTIPQFGRFYRVSLLCMYAFIFIDYIKYRPRFYYYIRYPFIASILFYVLVDTRIALDTFSIDTFLSNPIFTFTGKSNIPTIDLIK